MAQHQVRFTIPRRELGKVDVEFEVRRDGALFGTLKVSNGAIVWEPANAKKYEFKVGWRSFDAFAQEHGQAIER